MIREEHEKKLFFDFLLYWFPFTDDTPGTSKITFFRFLIEKLDDTPGTAKKLFFNFFN